jgi:menaquinone-9 beta-reductase
MNTHRPIEIIGGGLAGLSLGLALRRQDVPVTLHERGTYPRHRVCGEFIRGLTPDTVERLGLAPHLTSARQHHALTWFLGETPWRRQALPSPALAISRYELDARLADAFVEAGGDLRTRSRGRAEPHPGRVLTSGRRPDSSSPWLGLKVHVHGLALDRGLEMHLGDGAYVGLCALEENVVNVCGLFRQRSLATNNRGELLPAYLRACGLEALADRIDQALPDPDSLCAVAGLAFSSCTAATPELPCIGDACAMIPPFTGNGMAMAFAGAAAAVDPLVAWSRHEATWTQTVNQLQERLRHNFGLRLRVAQACHPFLLNPARQRWFAAADGAGLLPVGTLARVLS